MRTLHVSHSFAPQVVSLTCQPGLANQAHRHQIDFCINCVIPFHIHHFANLHGLHFCTLWGDSYANGQQACYCIVKDLVNRCFSGCSAECLSFASLITGNTCLCRIYCAGTSSLRVPSTSSYLKCTGNSTEKCGGYNRMSMYRIAYNGRACA
jgi:hypothetical protein